MKIAICHKRYNYFQKFGEHPFYHDYVKYILNNKVTDNEYTLIVEEIDEKTKTILSEKGSVHFHEVKSIWDMHSIIKDVDVLHVIGTPKMTIQAIISAKMFEKPIVLGPYVLPIVPHVKHWKKYYFIIKRHGYLRSTYFYLVGELISKLSRGLPYLIFDSKMHRDMINPYGVTVKYTIDLGVDHNMFKPLKNVEKENIVLFIGNVVYFKGIEDFLRAMKLLEDSNIKGYIIGAGEIEKYKKIAPKNVKFLGKIPRENLVLYYNKAKVTVVASYFETYSYVALESLFCGTPIIVRNTLEHLLNKIPLNYLSTFSNANELAEEIMNMIKRNDIIDSEKIYKWMIKRYSWPVIYNRLTKIYTDLHKSLY